VAGWVSVTAGIVSKRLNLSENFLDHVVGPSFKHLGPLTPIPNSMGNPFIGGVKYTGVGKLAIFDVHCRLSRKRCEIGRWLLWNVNRKSWVPDWMV